MLEKQLRPSNIPMLVNPRVDENIWPKLKDNTQKADTKLSHVEQRLVKMMIAEVGQITKLNTLKDKVLGRIVLYKLFKFFIALMNSR